MADYFSAMFRRRPNDGWFQAGRYDVTTVDLVCALAVLSMFVYGILGSDDWAQFPFQSWLVREEFDLWRLITWPVAVQPDGWALLGVIFFWVFGQQLEGLFGREKFLGWMIAVTIAPAVVLTVLGEFSAEIDTTNAVYGLNILFICGIWVYAATYPQARWFDVVPLWAVAAVFTLLDLLRYNGNQLTGMVVFILVAIAVALLAARSLGLATGWPIPRLPIGGGGGSRRPPAGRARRSTGGRHSAPPRPTPGRGGSVVEGPWSAPPPPPRPTADAKAAQAELDALLDKISGSGLESLTASEKRRLNELSKQLRG